MIMKIKITLPLSLLLTAFVFTGCSSGTSNPQPTQTPQAPIGPISYQDIMQQFNPANYSSKVSLQATSNPCGAVMSDAGAGFIAATGFVNLIPDAGGILGAITGTTGSVLSLMGQNNSNNCIINEFNNIESQLYTQQQEINNISINLGLNSNNIWTAIYNNAYNITENEYTDFNNIVVGISGGSGFFQNTYSKAGFYNSESQSLTTWTLNQLVDSPSQLATLSNFLSISAASDPSYQSNLTNITGASIAETCPQGDSADTGNDYNENAISLCYLGVTKNASTVYMDLLSSTNSVLSLQLQQDLSTGESNIIPTLDAYNNTIVSYYQQSLYAVQELYHIAYLANYLNYQQSSSTMSDVLNIGGTYYQPSANLSESQNTIAYNTAQRNLTLVFAAVINQMYQNTLGYIVTDAPTWVQSYPDSQRIQYYTESGMQESGESINYTALVGAALHVNKRTATQYLYAALNAFSSTSDTQYTALTNNLTAQPLAESIINYQYGGLRNVASCLSSLGAYNESIGLNGQVTNALNNASCSSILTDANGNWVNQGVIESNTIQPYYQSATSHLPLLSGNVTNNVNQVACNPNQVGNLQPFSMYLYTPKAGVAASLGTPGVGYLMCGNFQTSYLTNQTGSNYATNLLPGKYLGLSGQYFNSSNYPGMLWSTYDTNAATWLYFNGHPTTVTQLDAYGLWSTTANGSFNGLSVGQPYSGFYSGWINDNWPSGTYNGQTLLHVIAVQTQQPDGFIAPYGITIGNAFNDAAAGPEGSAYINQAGIPQSSGFSVGIAPNPNVISAGVTINGQPLYDLSHINLAWTGYNQGTESASINNMISNYAWTPVNSTLPALWTAAGSGIGGAVSALGINGALMSTVGTISSGNGSVVICAVNTNNIQAGGYTYGFSSFASHSLGDGIVASFSLNCF